MEFIDLKEQYRRYKSQVDERIQRVVSHGHFIMGPEIGEVKQALAACFGVKHCISVASGTSIRVGKDWHRRGRGSATSSFP